jgi:hypothetical protein
MFQVVLNVAVVYRIRCHVYIRKEICSDLEISPNIAVLVKLTSCVTSHSAAIVIKFVSVKRQFITHCFTCSISMIEIKD